MSRDADFVSHRRESGQHGFDLRVILRNIVSHVRELKEFGQVFEALADSGEDRGSVGVGWCIHNFQRG